MFLMSLSGINIVIFSNRQMPRIVHAEIYYRNIFYMLFLLLENLC